MRDKIQNYATVDEYLANFSGDTRKKLDTLRETIKKVAPEAKEKIAYGIPTFTLHGNLVHFGGFKDHISLFPTASGVEAFKTELGARAASKGTIHFPIDKPLPLDLIARIVKFRVKQNKHRKARK